MSLLKKHLAAHPINGTREVHYATLLNAVPCAPSIVNGEPKAKVILTVTDGEAQSNFYVFRDAVAGLPTFIPQGGVKVMLTLQESEDKQYVNCIAAGIAAA